MSNPYPKPLYHFFYKYKPHQIMRVVRKNLGLTQKSVADQLGTTPSHISQLENGKAEVYAGFWFRFCELTFISSDTYSCGYNKRFHMNAAWAAIKEKRFNFPVTSKVLLSIEHNELLERKIIKKFERDMFSGIYSQRTSKIASSSCRG